MPGFLDLPRELRDAVYTIALTTFPAGPRIEEVPACRDGSIRFVPHFSKAVPQAASTNLLLLNRQINRETTECIARLEAKGKLAAKLDVIFRANSVFWVTWLHIPIVTSHIETLDIYFRTDIPVPASHDAEPDWVLLFGTQALCAKMEMKRFGFLLHHQGGCSVPLPAPAHANINDDNDNGQPRVSVGTVRVHFSVGHKPLDEPFVSSSAKLVEKAESTWARDLVRDFAGELKYIIRSRYDIQSAMPTRQAIAFRKIRRIKLEPQGDVMSDFEIPEHFTPW